MPARVFNLEAHEPTKYARFRIRKNQERPNRKPGIVKLDADRVDFIRHIEGLKEKDMIPVLLEKITAEVEAEGKETTQGNLYRATGRPAKRLLCMG